jgi:hypothetical protein
MDWIDATNWSTWKDNIYTGAPAIVNFNVTPSNSLIYVRKNQLHTNSVSWCGTTLPYVVHDAVNNVVLSGSRSGLTEGGTVSITANLTNYNKITLSTGIADLTVKFTLAGTAFNATDEGNGNYSINVVGSGTAVSYKISGGGYRTATGSITTTGSNITQNVTMEVATEESWTRPNLVSNGGLGGLSFAVTASDNLEQAWCAVDDISQDMYSPWYAYLGEESQYYIFYNPEPLKVSELVFYFDYSMSDEVNIYGSEDGNSWELIDSTYNSTSERDDNTGLKYTTCILDNGEFYNYYKIVLSGRDYAEIYDLLITATYLA